MKFLVSILKQEALGILNLSLPILFLVLIASNFGFSSSIILFCSSLLGLYLFLLNHKITKNQIKNLKFEPNLANKEKFEKLIEEVGIDKNLVNLRYSYSNEMICTTTFNTISIDPLFWHGLDNDDQAIEAKKVIEQYILPQALPIQKERLQKLKAILTPQAQNFIFRHELGHIYYRYSIKKLILIGLFGTSATFLGFLAGIALNSFLSGLLSNMLSSYLSIFFGLIVGGMVDIILSYLSNLFFKLNEENKADLFAVKFSSLDEINDAADFFEKYHEITHDRNSCGVLSFLPNSILIGYNDGKTRAKILRDLAFKKRVA